MVSLSKREDNMRKYMVIAVVSLMSLAFISSSFAADTGAVKKNSPPEPGIARAMPAKMPRSNFSMLYGKISKIDTSDPANAKIEVINEADNATHIIDVPPSTNITKATDISELKTGENVRIMARKVDSKEVAMGVMFGKIRKPMPRPAIPAAKMIPPAAAPIAQEKPKK
jgi:hypothetical protein